MDEGTRQSILARIRRDAANIGESDRDLIERAMTIILKMASDPVSGPLTFLMPDDDAIRRISRVLREGTRGIDLAARIGGEEFAVLLVETSKDGGFEVAERLRTAIKSLEIPKAGRVTASFGVAECPGDAQTSADILKAADVALYEAKRNGRDQVVAMQPLMSNSVAAGDVQSDGNLGLPPRG